MSQSTNILAYNHESTMEQRISSIDKTLAQNPVILPNTTQTSVPIPKMVKIFGDPDKQNAQVVNLEKDQSFR